MLAGKQYEIVHLSHLEQHVLKRGFPQNDNYSVYLEQISEVVNSMKDLIDYSRDNKIGPLGIIFIAIRLQLSDKIDVYM